MMASRAEKKHRLLPDWIKELPDTDGMLSAALLQKAEELFGANWREKYGEGWNGHMDPRTGEIVTRPQGMSDEDWQKMMAERGLVELKGEDAERFAAQARAISNQANFPKNRQQRRAYITQQRKARKR